jgi:hypothetical protein
MECWSAGVLGLKEILGVDLYKLFISALTLNIPVFHGAGLSSVEKECNEQLTTDNGHQTRTVAKNAYRS